MNRRACALVLIAPVLLLAACSGSSGGSPSKPSAAPTSSGPAFESQRAAEILTAARSDAEAKGSVHVDGIGQVGGLALHGSFDVDREHGSQTTRFGPHSLSELFVDGVAYVRSDAFGLEQLVGLSASQAQTYAGKWIAFHRGDPLYADAIDSMTLASGLHTSLDLTSAKKVAGTTVNGVSTIGISGTDPTGDAETVYIGIASPHLPVSARSTGSGFNVTETFSQWGEAVHATAPAGAVRAPH